MTQELLWHRMLCQHEPRLPEDRWWLVLSQCPTEAPGLEISAPSLAPLWVLELWREPGPRSIAEPRSDLGRGRGSAVPSPGVTGHQFPPGWEHLHRAPQRGPAASSGFEVRWSAG